MNMIQCLSIAICIRGGRTLNEREVANQMRQWCIAEWLQGHLDLPEGALKILLEA